MNSFDEVGIEFESDVGVLGELACLIVISRKPAVRLTEKVLISKRLIRGGNPSGEALSDNDAGVLAFQDLRYMALLVCTAPSSILLLRHEIDDIPLCGFFITKEVSLVVEIQGLC